MNLRIGIIEADPAFRERLKNHLNKLQMKVVLSVENFQELAIEATSEDQFDLLLVHLNEETIHHFFKYKRLFPKAYLVAHANENESRWAEKAVTEGADAYVMKNGNFRNLQQAIESVAVGQAWLAPEATRSLIEKVREVKIDARQAQAQTLETAIRKIDQQYHLKAREIQVLRGLLNAKSYSQIAEDLEVSVNTVRHYVKSLYRKMDINNRSTLQKIAFQGGHTAQSAG